MFELSTVCLIDQRHAHTYPLLIFFLQMCDRFKIKLQQTTHALGVLAYNQRLLIDNTAEDGGFDREFVCIGIIRLTI